MLSKTIRQKFLDFFAQHDHSIIGSARLIPEHDPTVLFTTAGMHPLVPYLLGETHPAGVRLANYQKCIRTGDIESVGDRWHLTFFEMLGNWSLGDYFKDQAIRMSHEFLTNREWLGIDSHRLHVSVFAGDADAPRDIASADIWRSLGIPAEHIYYYPKSANWWGPAGSTGPCGPDTEMYYDTGIEKCSPGCNPDCSCGKYVEIWNDVFMQYNKMADGTYQPLKQQNVDTGMGLERITAVLNGAQEVYTTDLFAPIMAAITARTQRHEDTSKEIICDHIRAATFIMADGISPSNLDQGYVLRRLIRRAIRHGRKLGIEGFFLQDLADIVIQEYSAFYPELEKNRSEIKLEFVNEEEKFSKTLEKGEKQFAKLTARIKPNGVMPGEQAFHLFDTYGFPFEITQELAHEQGITIDEDGFNDFYKQHQEQSRTGAQKRFKGGLADASWETIRGHTATHLLHEALRRILGPHVYQKGSNITPERLRFDFSHPEKVTPEQLKEIEDMVNEEIQRGLEVHYEIMSVEQAHKIGAIGLFDDKYAEKVKVYLIGDFSKEFCGGPHVNNTTEVGKFKIVKEEACSAGIRRIKAVVIHILSC
ncbi:MAG: alanine--tRNA ligase [Candidatus Kerfeldbacteria bacterium]|nr:alanine--tRNA ligase [Candidatus Kerfeldbacteria bacterium]